MCGPGFRGTDSAPLLMALDQACKISVQPASMVSMPELPDITAYISALEPRIVGQPLEHVRVASAFLLRTARPPVAAVEGHMVRELRRIGKRIAIGVEGDLWLVLHLMIAGRLHWRPPGAKLAGRKIWLPSTSPMVPLCSRKRGPSAAPRCTSSQGRRHCVPLTPEGSMCCPAILTPFATRSRSRIALSRGL